MTKYNKISHFYDEEDRKRGQFDAPPNLQLLLKIFQKLLKKIFFGKTAFFFKNFELVPKRRDGKNPSLCYLIVVLPSFLYRFSSIYIAETKYYGFTFKSFLSRKN